MRDQTNIFAYTNGGVEGNDEKLAHDQSRYDGANHSVWRALMRVMSLLCDMSCGIITAESVKGKTIHHRDI